eukprot:scaffold19854_cov64-Phaeocystis_antarctica.AAC.2
MGRWWTREGSGCKGEHTHVSCCICRCRTPQVVSPCRLVRTRSQVALDAGMGQSRHQWRGHEEQHAPCPSPALPEGSLSGSAKFWARVALICTSVGRCRPYRNTSPRFQWDLKFLLFLPIFHFRA